MYLLIVLVLACGNHRRDGYKFRKLRGVWYMHLKICVLLFENICGNTCENTYNVI